MAEAKHTSGPWSAEPQGGRGAWIRGSNGSWAALACGDTDAEADANARLIAAAPEAVQSVKDLLSLIEAIDGGEHNDAPEVVAAHAVIAKAEGL